MSGVCPPPPNSGFAGVNCFSAVLRVLDFWAPPSLFSFFFFGLLGASLAGLASVFLGSQ